MKIEEISINYEGEDFVGHLAFDDARSHKRPGVLVIHEATGLDHHAREVADRIADEFDFVALAMDLFGETPATLNDAIGWITRFMTNPAELHGRLTAAFDALTAHPNVDPGRIAAIGYCFGGTAAIELARTGADVKAVVAFHAGVQGTGLDASRIRAKILVCNGAQDPFFTVENRDAFSSEMISAGVDWQLNIYGQARHSFTNKNAAQLGSDAYEYDANADRRSWAAMRQLFEEIF
jgi:dienelactone hydrolase